MPLKQVYCGGSSARRYSTPQNTRAIAAGIWNATIDLMYSGGPKKRRNRRHIAAVFVPAAIGPPQLLSFLVVVFYFYFVLGIKSDSLLKQRDRVFTNTKLKESHKVSTKTLDRHKNPSYSQNINIHPKNTII